MEEPTVVGVAFRTRLLRIERVTGCWRLWTDTKDYLLGTYLALYDDGKVDRVTERADEGPDIVNIKPKDPIR